MTERAGDRREAREGRVAIITGGSQGIGYATVEAFAGHGMRVAAVSRDPGRLEAALASLDAHLRGKVVAVSADVRREAEVIAAVSEIVERFGRIDVLVNSAGVSMNARRRFSDTTADEWHRLIDTNLTGTYLMCRAVIPHLEAAGGGYILNVLSTGAYSVTAGSSLYAASKYGARALTEALIEEYRNSGIRATSVSPGPVDTTIWEHKLVPPSEEERARMLRPSDIADIFIWLLSRPEWMHIPNITVTPWVLRDAKMPPARSAQGS